MIIAIIVFAVLLCIGMPIAICLGLFGIAHITTCLLYTSPSPRD